MATTSTDQSPTGPSTIGAPAAEGSGGDGALVDDGLSVEPAVDHEEPDAGSSGLLDRLPTPSELLTVERLRGWAGVLFPPFVGIGGFLLFWALVAPRIDTSLGELPGPDDVWDAGRVLWDQHQASRAEEAAFYAAQDARNVDLAASGQPIQDFQFNGPPTFVDQIWTSLQTVALGFALGTVVAVPVGLLSGLSTWFQRAINPLVQIFRPVSPVAWLPIVTMVISAAITSNDPFLPKAFIISALVVTLTSLWPTLINTSVGASAVDKDLLNVAEVLRLGWFTRLRRIVLPSALPYIFTGMRLSLGIGWMVLIAAELLAQNPGLGKFVWDEFQNGSSQSLSRIMFAVIVIGIIGFLLDRLMAGAESLVSRNRVSS
ncbi:MAG: ABC transporter permease [Actinomycetota bacterium]